MAGNRLISERDIIRAVRDGAKTIEVGGAAVTPSARDAAKRSGIELVVGGSAPPSGAKAEAAPPPTAPTRPALSVALGADHGGVALKDAVAARLRELGHNVTDLGTTGNAAVDYPDYAIAVAST